MGTLPPTRRDDGDLRRRRSDTPRRAAVLALVALMSAVLSCARSHGRSPGSPSPARPDGGSAAPDGSPSARRDDEAIAIDVGTRNGCVVRADGQVACWGHNFTGAVTGGSEAVEPEARRIGVATLVPGVAGAIDVSVGSDRVCALLEDGTAACWGWAGRVLPTELTVLDAGAPIVEIDVGNPSECVRLASGTVRCRGFNGNAELGSGDLDDHAELVEPAGLDDVVDLATGGNAMSCALERDGDVRCWGSGVLAADGVPFPDRVVAPTLVTRVVGGVRVATNAVSACVLTDGGAVHCWGSPAPGPGLSGPTRVVGGDGFVARDLALGTTYGCALDAVGSVVCWGWNERGQLGDGTTTARRTPAPVVGLAGPATRIVAAYEQTCALLASGTWQCWGAGYPGQGELVDPADPVRVEGLDGVVRVVSAWSGSCALDATGGVSCWGTVFSDGRGYAPVVLAPRAVEGFEDVTDLCVTGGAVCALSTDGAVRCAGTGYLGDGVHHDVPATVEVDGVAPASSVHCDSLGAQTMCAVRATGEVRCWGDLTAVDRGVAVSAVELSELDGAARVAPRPDSVWVAYQDGSAAELYRRTLTPLHGSRAADGSTPLASVARLSRGHAHGCALAGTEAYCVSYVEGPPRSVLTTLDAVTGLTRPTTLASGGNHSCAVEAAGTLACWGWSYFGQLGSGLWNAESPAPTRVRGLEGVVDVSAGLDHTCAVTRAGEVYCWGSNAYGQLGSSRHGVHLTPVGP